MIDIIASIFRAIMSFVDIAASYITVGGLYIRASKFFGLELRRRRRRILLLSPLSGQKDANIYPRPIFIRIAIRCGIAFG